MDFVSDNLYTYLSLFMLSYAEDTVIYGLNEKDFQKKKLDIFYKYAKIWKLNIDYDKTNLLIFGTRKDDQFNFKMCEEIFNR